MRDELDKILTTVYQDGELPKEELNQTILQKAKEYESMRQSDQKRNDRKNHSGRMIKAAAVVGAILLVGGSGAYAAERLNLFGGLFGGADESSVKEYIASTDADDAISVDKEETADNATQASSYEGMDEKEGYKVTVNQHMYNKETGSGVLQFTVEDLTGEGRSWYEVANVQDVYDDWEMGCREQTEIYTGIEDGKQYIDFTIKGLSLEDSRTYINTKESTDNKKVCQIIYNDFEDNDLSQNLALMVRTHTMENDISSGGVMMTLQIPKAESLPCYVWENADPYNRVILSNYCYLLNAPEINSNSYEHQNELAIQSEVYVTMKGGTQYWILSDENKISNECYGTGNLNDTQWHSFFNLLNLDMVESFTIDGVTFHTKDATLVK
ncbi:MAG TPA: hypothetical protein DHV96_11775 [Lachnospiraceae bacterium]|nr:hypothetical protein [Lachnospiraceae bacterium]